MTALGWVATMRGGRVLPFRLAEFDYRSDAYSAAVCVGIGSVDYNEARAPDGALFEIRGTVQRPTLQGGTVTKLVLREATTPRG